MIGHVDTMLDLSKTNWPKHKRLIVFLQNEFRWIRLTRYETSVRWQLGWQEGGRERHRVITSTEAQLELDKLDYSGGPLVGEYWLQ